MVAQYRIGSNFDWESLALGPCPQGRNCLFVADTGDNFKLRPFYSIYMVNLHSLDVNPINYKRLDLVYDDGKSYDESADKRSWAAARIFLDELFS